MIIMCEHCSIKAIGLLLFFVAVMSNVDGICWNCMPQNMSDDDIERVLALDFKKRLMEKLGMESEPEVPEDLTIPPREVISELFPFEDEVMDEEDHGTTQNIFLQPLNNDSTIYNTTSYFEYKISSDELNGYSIDHVILLLSANGHTGPYEVYEKSSSIPRRMVFMDKIQNASEWKKVVFTPNELWLKKPWRKLRIEIKGIKTPIVHEPLLQLSLKRTVKRVMKRSSNQYPTGPTGDCNQMTKIKCCKHHKTIEITKYMKWIYFPQFYRAFTCSGPCPAHHRANYTWTYLSQTAAPLRHVRTPCCVPSALDPMSILFFSNKKKKGTANKKGKTKDALELKHKILNNMVVKSCACV